LKNCEVLQSKIHYLIIKNLSKFILGKAIWKYVFDKVRIGYRPTFQGKVKLLKLFFSYKKSNASLFITCSYCTWKGHNVKNYKTKKFDVPNSLVKWMPKIVEERINICEPKIIRVSYLAT